MTRKLTRGVPLIAFVVVAACPAQAGTLTAGGGFDLLAGPDAQSNRSALLFGSATAAPGDLTVAAIRYDDSRLGPGTGLFANAGIASASRVGLRIQGLRSLGDDDFDTWRLRAGPEMRVGSDMTLGAYYLQLHNDAPEDLRGGGVEVSVPVSTSLTAQVGSSYGRWTGGATTAQGMLSGTWRAQDHVQFLFEVDVGRNVTTTSTHSPSGGWIGSGLPIANPLGGGSSSTETTTDRRITASGLLGIRFVIP